MTMRPPTDAILRFGRFEIHPAGRVLRVDGANAAVGARAFDLLLALAERRERLVTKQELLDLVWPGVIVEEHNIAAQMSTLRKLLGPDVIATVPGRGYQFTAALEVATEGAHDATAALPRERHNLPQQRTRFIGRTAALADLARLVPQSRLLTLTGIGGSGKTRLALQFAQQQLAAFADGVWFVDLAPLKESQRVAAACAAALSLGTELETPSAEQLAAILAQRQMLIVLDNCEHVLDGAATLVDAVLARPGETRIIATSREPLAVPGEQLYPVRSLSLPASADLDDVRAADAVRVFVDRARLTLPEFEVDAHNAAAVVDICVRLDGIALAIELAAARVSMLSMTDIAARLKDRFRLLAGGSSPSARQQTLAAAMQWSYDLLAPVEQRMLRQLAVFAGGCTLEAATAVAGVADEYAALALLTALQDKSLLVVERGIDGGAAGRPRYGMLETVREYAQERLDASDETEAARKRHAEYFLGLAEAAAPHLRGPQQSLWMARLRDEQENLLAAITWCTDDRAPVDPQYGLRFVAATERYWLFNEIELGCRLALAALQRDRDGVDSAPRVRTLCGLAAAYMHRGQGELGFPHAQTAAAMSERLGLDEWQAMALSSMGSCLRQTGDEQASLQYYERARDLAHAGGYVRPLTSALNNIATIEFRRGALDAAEPKFRQALNLSRGSGDVRSALINLHNLVRVLVAGRKHDEARACAVESELLLRSVSEDVLKLELLEVVAGLASSQGRHALAARWWGATRQRYIDAGYRRPPEDEALLTRLYDSSRDALGDAAFDEAEATGRALDVDSAMLELRHWLHRA